MRCADECLCLSCSGHPTFDPNADRCASTCITVGRSERIRRCELAAAVAHTTHRAHYDNGKPLAWTDREALL